MGSMDSIVRGGTIEEYSDDAVFGPALDSYENSLEDIGEVQGFNNEQAVLDSDGNYLINIGVDGSNHDADVVITVGVKTGTPSNVATNVRYTLGELMEQAGLNTILGMGTTFVILILLSLIISAFALIGKSQANKKKKAAAIQAAEAPAAAPVAEVAEEVTDDNELIAVIAAAVAASEGQTTTDGFVVRSIRKARSRF